MEQIELLAFKRKRTYDRKQNNREAICDHGDTRTRPCHVAIMVGRTDERRLDTQIDSVDIRMGKTRTRREQKLLPHSIDNGTWILPEVPVQLQQGADTLLQIVRAGRKHRRAHFFVYPRWNDCREQTEANICTSTPENVVGKMLQNDAGWGEVTTFVEKILRLKREESHPDD